VRDDQTSPGHCLPIPSLRAIGAALDGAVIDTNVVLDWLVFADARVQALRTAVEAGQVTWWATETMRAELAQMLAHRDLQRWAPDAGAALTTFDRLARTLPEPPPAGPALRCRDADDQVFIDLAVAQRARWLITRDGAVLALARRAQAHGVQIVVPGRWAR
jgi:uncharacterized protein